MRQFDLFRSIKSKLFEYLIVDLFINPRHVMVGYKETLSQALPAVKLTLHQQVKVTEQITPIYPRDQQGTMCRSEALQCSKQTEGLGRSLLCLIKSWTSLWNSQSAGGSREFVNPVKLNIFTQKERHI